MNFIKNLIDRILNVSRVDSLGTICKTKKGEIVKSKYERKIANYFNDHNIDYQYEKPLKLGKTTIHPDFYLPEYDIYLEFWGLVDDAEYEKNMKFKMRQYKENNIDFISIYPKNARNLKSLDYFFNKKLNLVLDSKPVVKATIQDLALNFVRDVIRGLGYLSQVSLAIIIGNKKTVGKKLIDGNKNALKDTIYGFVGILIFLMVFSLLSSLFGKNSEAGNIQTNINTQPEIKDPKPLKIEKSKHSSVAEDIKKLIFRIDNLLSNKKIDSNTKVKSALAKYRAKLNTMSEQPKQVLTGSKTQSYLTKLEQVISRLESKI